MNAKGLARAIVQASDDRMKNYIVIDDVRLPLEPMATLEEAKAQWADALWAVEKIIEAGRVDAALAGASMNREARHEESASDERADQVGAPIPTEDEL